MRISVRVGETRRHTFQWFGKEVGGWLVFLHVIPLHDLALLVKTQVPAPARLLLPVYHRGICHVVVLKHRLLKLAFRREVFLKETERQTLRDVERQIRCSSSELTRRRVCHSLAPHSSDTASVKTEERFVFVGVSENIKISRLKSLSNAYVRSECIFKLAIYSTTMLVISHGDRAEAACLKYNMLSLCFATPSYACIVVHHRNQRNPFPFYIFIFI